MNSKSVPGRDKSKPLEKEAPSSEMESADVVTGNPKPENKTLPPSNSPKTKKPAKNKSPG